MKFYRYERVASLIREKLSWILEREVEVPAALITITEVVVEKKLDYAKVRVSVFPSEKASQAMRELGRRVGELQFTLARQLNIRPMPRISFLLDRGPENAAKVEKALLEDNNKEVE
jgi:ribosome-binding factor A